MKYVEMPIEDAIKVCKKNTNVLVAIQDLEDKNVDIVLVSKRGSESDELFNDVKTVASMCDEFVNQLKLFTEKQDIRNVRPYGIQKTVMLRE